ncbi:retrovirus-related pol polyprotein from transposon TNT 1-94 [Tanacetum coccineum]
MYKHDPVILAPKVKNNREAHEYYLKHTIEQAAILREVVKQAKSQNPLDSESYSAYKYVKLIQELLGYVRDICHDIHKPCEQLVPITPINKRKMVSYMFDARHELCFLEFVSDMNASSKSKSVKKAKKKEEWKPTRKNPVHIEDPILQLLLIVLWYLDSGCSKHMTRDRSQLTNFVHKFLGTVKFGNDHIAKIIGYGDYQIGNITISRVYYVEGLGHNLFSVVQICDSDLEVAFRKHTCFVRNLKGDDLLSGSQETNLYTLSIRDMMASSLICLAKLKFEKDHVCSACAMGKSKKQSHKPNSEDTNQEKLYLLHMDLYGPMRVASINMKKYILVIMDDYSRFTWVKFMASKDEAPDFIIKFLKMIEVRLNATVRNIRTDNGTDFVNQTLCSYYENVGISHETSVARTPQQNGVVERRNRTLVEAAQTIKPDLSYLYVIGALCYPNNDSKDLGKLQAKADIGIFIGYEPKKKAYRPDLQCMIAATSSSGLVLYHIPQQPFPVTAAPRTVDLADSLVSTSIDQDAPSKSIPSTQEQEHSLIISQGFEESLKMPHFHDDPLHESLHEDSTSQGLSSNVKPIQTPFESLGRWTKDHPIANVIEDPSRSVSTKKQLQTDAMWCYFDAFLTSVEPKNFKQAMTEPSWIDEMQEEIHEF